jgi:hypothetical protein
MGERAKAAGFERTLDALLLARATGSWRLASGPGGLLGRPPEPDPDPVTWAEQVSRQPLDPWQRDVMASHDPALLLLCPRQTGKSHIVSLVAAYLARYRGYRVGCLSPTLRQSGVIYRRAREWLHRSGMGKFLRQSAIELELPAGGYIACFPGDRPDLSIRGDTLDVLILDEASRVKDGLIAAATPTPAPRPDARIIYLSTPAGQRGEFYRAWKDQAWWRKVAVAVGECPRIKPDFLARERVRLGPLYRQEYECEFLTAPGGLFDPDKLDEIFRDPRQLAEDNEWLPKTSGETTRAW